MESAQKDAVDLQQKQPQTLSVNAINRSSYLKSPCPCCEGSHWSSDCPFRNKAFFQYKKRRKTVGLSPCQQTQPLTLITS